MIDKPGDEWTAEDWKRMKTEAFEASERALDAVEDQGKLDGTFSVQVAGYGLIIAMGRLCGKHGYRHIEFEAVWKLWTDDNAKREFEHAFFIERQAEN